MRVHRCAARCPGCSVLTRRKFVAAASASLVAVSAGLGGLVSAGDAPVRIRPAGPASRCKPSVKVAFVRRKGEYGIRWPGQIYDGHAARKMYTEKIAQAAQEIGLRADLRPEPIYSLQEAEAWIAEAVSQKADGLLVVLLDRQEHSWPTAEKALDSKLPTVIYSPVGSSFTTNTAGPSKKTGGVIFSTDDFRQARYGMKMLHAAAKMRATRCLVIAGSKRAETTMPQLGIQLQYIPAKTFLEEYEKTPASEEVRRMATELIRGATRQVGPTEQDVINGIKSYLVAGQLLQREQADAITMDCLGALGRTKVSLPCIAWSKMNDDGIPAACEADLGAVASHIVVQYLFDRPGFQQDPVAETARDAIIGAHCSCPTRLKGFGAQPEPYDLVHHHGMRDATARPVWPIGQRVTSVDVLPGSKEKPAQMIISTGSVLENVSVPPAGGCVVSVMVKFDGVTDTLAYPGFHQVFFFGDFKKELLQFCQLCGIEPVVA